MVVPFVSPHERRLARFRDFLPNNRHYSINATTRTPNTGISATTAAAATTTAATAVQFRQYTHNSNVGGADTETNRFRTSSSSSVASLSPPLQNNSGGNDTNEQQEHRIILSPDNPRHHHHHHHHSQSGDTSSSSAAHRRIQSTQQQPQQYQSQYRRRPATSASQSMNPLNIRPKQQQSYPPQQSQQRHNENNHQTQHHPSAANFNIHVTTRTTGITNQQQHYRTNDTTNKENHHDQNRVIFDDGVPVDKIPRPPPIQPSIVVVDSAATPRHHQQQRPELLTTLPDHNDMDDIHNDSRSTVFFSPTSTTTFNNATKTMISPDAVPPVVTATPDVLPVSTTTTPKATITNITNKHIGIDLTPPQHETMKSGSKRSYNPTVSRTQFVKSSPTLSPVLVSPNNVLFSTSLRNNTKQSSTKMSLESQRRHHHHHSLLFTYEDIQFCTTISQLVQLQTRLMVVLQNQGTSTNERQPTETITSPRASYNNNDNYSSSSNQHCYPTLLRTIQERMEYIRRNNVDTNNDGDTIPSAHHMSVDIIRNKTDNIFKVAGSTTIPTAGYNISTATSPAVAPADAVVLHRSLNDTTRHRHYNVTALSTIQSNRNYASNLSVSSSSSSLVMSISTTDIMVNHCNSHENNKIVNSTCIDDTHDNSTIQTFSTCSGGNTANHYVSQTIPDPNDHRQIMQQTYDQARRHQQRSSIENCHLRQRIQEEEKAQRTQPKQPAFNVSDTSTIQQLLQSMQLQHQENDRLQQQLRNEMSIRAEAMQRTEQVRERYSAVLQERDVEYRTLQSSMRQLLQQQYEKQLVVERKLYQTQMKLKTRQADLMLLVETLRSTLRSNNQNSVLKYGLDEFIVSSSTLDRVDLHKLVSEFNRCNIAQRSMIDKMIASQHRQSIKSSIKNNKPQLKEQQHHCPNNILVSIVESDNDVQATTPKNQTGNSRMGMEARNISGGISSRSQLRISAVRASGGRVGLQEKLRQVRRSQLGGNNTKTTDASSSFLPSTTAGTVEGPEAIAESYRVKLERMRTRPRPLGK